MGLNGILFKVRVLFIVIAMGTSVPTRNACLKVWGELLEWVGMMQHESVGTGA
jgi:hypothetical protein